MLTKLLIAWRLMAVCMTAILAGAAVMMLIATLTASLVANSGRSAWFVGVLVLMVYLLFALTFYLLPSGAAR